MNRKLGLTVLLLGAACNLPPKDPFAAAERALRRADLLRALQAYDAVPVAHARYPDARAAAGDVEQRMRRCHELILEALKLRSEWRDEEALEALHRASEHWPGQPSLKQWIAATEQRLQLFGSGTVERDPAQLSLPATPLIEVAKVGGVQSSVGPMRTPASNGAAAQSVVVAEPHEPKPLPPEVGAAPSAESQLQSSQPPMVSSSSSAEQLNAGTMLADSIAVATVPIGSDGADASKEDVASLAGRVDVAPDVAEQASANPRRNGSSRAGVDGGVPGVAESKSASASPNRTTKRLPLGEDPVALGLVSVEGCLFRGQLSQAVRDLIELARRFPDDARVNRRLSRLLHQRALMSYGQGAVAAAIADWRRVLELDAGHESARESLQRALRESGSSSKN